MTGRWPQLLMEIGVDERFLTKRAGPCPFCGGRDRFTFDDLQGRGTYYCRKCSDRGGDGMQFLITFANVPFREALGIVRDFLGCAETIPINGQPHPIASDQKKTTDPRKARELWDCAAPIRPNDNADKYLRSRKIGLETYPSALRYAECAPYYDDGKPAPDEYSALITLVTGADGAIRTVHRTYLRGGRKANVRAPKKLASQLAQNSSIKLYECDADLAVGEGIETCLAIRKMTGLPVWSLISAGNMLKFEPPPSVKRIAVYGDNDRFFAGQKAAFSLAERLSSRGINVDVLIPDRPGFDWLDVFIEDQT